MSDKGREAVEKIKESQVKLDLVRLLRDNPYIMDTGRGLALWAALSEDLVGRELEDLVSFGVLRKYGDGPSAIYRYTEDKDVRAFIDEHWPELERSMRDHFRTEQTEG